LPRFIEPIFSTEENDMRMLLVAVGLLTAGLANASTLIDLPNAHAPASLQDVHWGYCSASGFSADGLTVLGACQYSYGASAGRYHPSPTITYHSSWNLKGVNLGLGAVGGQRNYDPNGTVFYPNGAPLYYISTGVNGDQLGCSNNTCYIVVP
jgi:hypothetical protein